MPKKESVPSSEESEKSVVSEPKLSFPKYVQLHFDGIHPYSFAYLKVELIGILKTKDEWDEDMKKRGVK